MSGKEKRKFKRYSRQTDLKIRVAGETFDAKAVDYSIDGVGAVFDKIPPIANGSIVGIDVSSNECASGRVVWSRTEGGNLRLGIFYLCPVRKGRLENYPLADILIGLQRSGLTGILEVKSGTVVKSVYIKKGDLIFASSNLDSDRLGDMLLREGKITSGQYDHSIEVLKKTGKRQGTVLVELGYLKPFELVWAVKHYVEEIIISLFSLDDGEFEFREGRLPSDEVITLKLSAANIIYQGIKRIDDPKRIFEFLQLPMDSVLCFSSDPLNLFQNIRLSEADKRILSFVNGRSSIKDIIALSSCEESLVLKSVSALLGTRIIEVKEEDEEHADLSAEDVIGGPSAVLDEEFIDKIDGLYPELETLGFYKVLGVNKLSDRQDIKKAFYKAAKEFHPDRHFNLRSDAVKDKLNAIFSYITLAYTTLSDSKKKADYDRQLSLRTSPGASSEETARSKFEEGRKEFGKGNYADAFHLFGQAVYLNKAVAEHHYYYGLTLVRLNRFKEAERAVSRALEHEPFNAAYLAELGHIFLRLGFPTRARSNFEKAVKIDPSNKRAAEGLLKVQE